MKKNHQTAKDQRALNDITQEIKSLQEKKKSLQNKKGVHSHKPGIAAKGNLSPPLSDDYVEPPSVAEPSLAGLPYSLHNFGMHTLELDPDLIPPLQPLVHFEPPLEPLGLAPTTSSLSPSSTAPPATSYSKAYF